MTVIPFGVILRRMHLDRVILNGYFEQLHEWLVGERERLMERFRPAVEQENRRCGLGIAAGEYLEAYVDACVAFLDERIETYNPVGLQWTFPKTTVEEAFALEAALDWYDSRTEFETIVRAIQKKIAQRDRSMPLNEAELSQWAKKLIDEFGAYPNRTIIDAYEQLPEKNRLPDYIIAIVMENALKSHEY